MLGPARRRLYLSTLERKRSAKFPLEKPQVSLLNSEKLYLGATHTFSICAQEGPATWQHRALATADFSEPKLGRNLKLSVCSHSTGG